MSGMSNYRIVPLTLSQANSLVAQWHRHHKPVVGHRFAIGVELSGVTCGAAIVGRPVSRELDAYRIAEVTRLVTVGTKNSCSILYAACARIAKEMGFDWIQTYILESEPGTSVEAAGWKLDGLTSGGNWNHSWAFGGTRREDQPMGKKKRFVKILNANVSIKVESLIPARYFPRPYV